MSDITKAALAKELGANRSQVTRWTIAGMPVLPSGRLDRQQALRWISGNCDSHRGGWLLRRNGRDISAVARKLLAADQPTTIQSVRRELLDRVLSHRGLIPELLLKLGCRDMVAVIASEDIFASIIILFAGELADEAYNNWIGEDIPHVNVDYPALAKRYGFEFKPEDDERAGTLVDRLWELLNKPSPKEPRKKTSVPNGTKVSEQTAQPAGAEVGA